MVANRWFVVLALVSLFACGRGESVVTGPDLDDDADSLLDIAGAKPECGGKKPCGGGGGAAYAVHMLPAPAGYHSPEAFGVNDDRRVVGVVWSWNGEQAAWWDVSATGEIVTTGLLLPGELSAANAVNNDGVIVGWRAPLGSSFADQQPFALTSSGVVVNLPTVPYCGGDAEDIDDTGRIAGHVWVCGYDPLTSVGALWTPTSGGGYALEVVSGIPATESSTLQALDGSGWAVGHRYDTATGTGFQAFVWDATGIVATAPGVIPRGMDQGMIVGTADAGNSITGVRWSPPAKPLTLSDLGGATTIAVDISGGTIVGSSNSRGTGWNMVPVIWSAPGYELVRLPLPGKSFKRGEAQAISGRGDIAGWGVAESPSPADVALIWIRQ